jgi:hypothetical protein
MIQAFVAGMEASNYINNETSKPYQASELSYLKAQIWTLQNQLKEEKKSTQNLTVRGNQKSCRKLNYS